MHAEEILRRLKCSGLRIYLHDKALRVEPKAALSDETRRLIREHRPALVRILSSDVHCAACRNIRMSEVVIPRVGGRFMWACAKGHLEHGQSTPALRNVFAPESCRKALDFVPIALVVKRSVCK